MRTIDRTAKFKRDYKREAKAYGKEELTKALRAVIDLLCLDQPLPTKFQDHPLYGEWKGCRDCHVKPDLVLIYEKPDDNTLLLARLGSHAELSL